MRLALTGMPDQRMVILFTVLVRKDCLLTACCLSHVSMQVFQQATDDISYLDYDADECDTELQSFFHDMSQMELRENCARCWYVSITYVCHCCQCSSSSENETKANDTFVKYVTNQRVKQEGQTQCLCQ